MATIVTLRILVTDDDENDIYDALNDVFQCARTEAEQVSTAPWLVGWTYDKLAPAPAELSASSTNGTYKEGDFS